MAFEAFMFFDGDELQKFVSYITDTHSNDALYAYDAPASANADTTKEIGTRSFSADSVPPPPEGLVDNVDGGYVTDPVSGKKFWVTGEGHYGWATGADGKPEWTWILDPIHFKLR